MVSTRRSSHKAPADASVKVAVKKTPTKKATAKKKKTSTPTVASTKSPPVKQTKSPKGRQRKTPAGKAKVPRKRKTTAKKKRTKKKKALVEEEEPMEVVTPQEPTDDDGDDDTDTETASESSSSGVSGEAEADGHNEAVVDAVVPAKRKRAAKEKTTKKEKAKKPRTEKKKKRKRHPNDKLTPRPQMTFYDKEPTFESKLPIPFVSVQAYNKMMIRAVLLNDQALLKRLINDVKNVSDLFELRSFDVPEDSKMYAAKLDMFQILDTLYMEGESNKRKRVETETSLLQRATTGQSNFHMLGRATRAIQMTRGGKEGNNALLKEPHYIPTNDYWIKAIENNISFETIKAMVAKGHWNPNELGQRVVNAVRHGHRKLAAKLVAEYGSSAFNDLHQQVLDYDNQKLKPFRAISVKKKGQNQNRSITPMHCACINPNVKYLEELLRAEPDFNHDDEDRMKCIHYAAVCTSTKPLELLLSKGASLFDVDKQHNTVLHHACRVGRAAVVDLLCRRLIEQERQDLVPGEEEEELKMPFINQRNREGYKPIHLAAAAGHLDVIKVFAKHGVDLETQSGAARGKVTAMIQAAAHGHLPIVKYLYETQNVPVDKKDKLKRTALLHACLNGNAHVVSYLLRVGCDPNLPDSSGNTPTHYAAAYGWYFVLQLLIEAGADVNVSNDWQLTPLAVAYLKGHVGLVDILKQTGDADLNCKDNDGKTLVMLTLTAGLDASTVRQLQYLLEENNVDCSATDTYNNTALHYLAIADVGIGDEDGKDEQWIAEQKKDLQIKAAKMIISKNCDVKCSNEQNETAISLALKNNYLDLAQCLIDNGCPVPKADGVQPGKNNALHDLVHIWEKQNFEGIPSSLNLAPLFQKIVDITDPNDMHSLLNQNGSSGFTPFLLACSFYHRFGEHKNLQQHLVNARTFISAMVDVYPQVLMQQTGKTPKEEEDEDYDAWDDYSDDNGSEEEETEEKAAGSYLNCLQLTVNGNAFEKNEKQVAINPLLVDLLEKAKVNNLLERLLKLQSTDGSMAIVNAVQARKTESVESLIFFGADPNSLFTHKSVETAHKEKDVREMSFGSVYHWRRYLNNLSKKDDQHKSHGKVASDAAQKSLLMLATEQEHVEMVCILLAHNADCKHKDSNGDTAMHYAAKKPTSFMAEIISLLLEAGADPLAQNNKQRLPLHLACNSHTGAVDSNLESIVLLKKEGGLHLTDVRWRLPLHYTFVKIGDHKNVSQMEPISLCSAIVSDMQDMHLNHADVFLQTPLHCAAKRGATICCMTMLRHKSIVVDAVDQNGVTPLALATLHGHQYTALALLQAQATIDIPIKETILGDYKDLEDFYKRNQYTFAPVKPFGPKEQVVEISDKVIGNDWQGVVYVLLDLLPRDTKTIYGLLTAAISNAKYNLAITLIQLLKEAMKKQQLLADDQSLKLHELMAKQKPYDDAALEEKVARALVNININWFSTNNSYRYTSHPYLEACKSRNYNLLKFYNSQVELFATIPQLPSGAEFYCKMPHNEEGHNQITSLLLNTSSHTIGETERELLKTFHGFGISANIVASFPVIPPTQMFVGSKHKATATENAYFVPQSTTLLIYALQMYDFDTVKFLINELQCNINACEPNTGRTPLMVATSLNDEAKIKLLMDTSFELQGTEKKKSKSRKKAQLVRVFGSLPVPKSQFSKQSTDDDQDEDVDDEENDEADDDDMDADEGSDEDYSPEEDDEPPAKKGKKGKQSKVESTEKAEPPFQMKSNLELNARDKSGRNVIHYLIRPFQCDGSVGCGSWENARLLKLLIDVGAEPDVADLEGMTPLDYATPEGELAHSLSKILRKPLEPTPATSCATVPNWPVVDYRQDAISFIDIQHAKKSDEEVNKEEAKKQKARLQPHTLSDYKDTGELIECEETKRLCSVLLNKVEVEHNSYGLYNFYRLQLIRRKGSELYIIFTNWGRIGDEGQYQRTPFNSFDGAMKEFRSIFRQKTGNQWSDVNSFEEHPKKYRLVKIDPQNVDKSLCDLEISLDSPVTPSLQPAVVQLLEDISNVKQLQRTVKQVSRLGVCQLPFGGATRETLAQARAVLVEVGTVIFSLKAMRDEMRKGERVDEALAAMTRIADLTNCFYRLVPMGGFARSALPMIDSEETWKDYCSAVDHLYESETAAQLVAGAALRADAVHPMDYIYNALRYETIGLQAPESDETQMILKYVHESAPDAKVSAVYELRSAERDAAFVRLDNRKMLWHGTSAANLLSILKEGLLPAPPVALHTGHMLGKGIYFADCFEKSSNYCQRSAAGKRYALLCDVSLGQSFTPDSLSNSEPLAPGKASLMGLGRQIPDPTYDLTMNSGTCMPLGGLMEYKRKNRDDYRSLNYNEYVVFNPKQVAIRYLVVF